MGFEMNRTLVDSLANLCSKLLQYFTHIASGVDSEKNM